MYDETEDLLYVGTNSGLFVYKQSQFVKVEGPENQRGNAVFQLKQNNKGEVYCCNLSGQIFKIKDYSMRVIYQEPHSKVSNSFYYFFDINDNIISSTSTNINKTTAEGKIEVLYHIPKEITGSFYSISQTLRGEIYFPVAKSDLILRYKDGILDTLPPLHFNRLDSRYFSYDENTFSICENGNINFELKGSTIKNFPNVKKESLFQFNNEEIIGLNPQKGMRILKIGGGKLTQSQHVFENLFVSTCYQNSNGTLFLGTFGEGVLVIPNKEITINTYNHLFLGIASSPNNDVFLSTREGQVFNAGENLELVGTKKSNIDRVFYVEGDFIFDDIKQKNIIYALGGKQIVDIKDYCQIDDNTHLIASYNGIKLISNSKTIEDSKLYYETLKEGSNMSLYFVKMHNRFNAVTYNSQDSLIYYSNSLGVYYTEWSSAKTESILFDNKMIQGNSIKYSNNKLYCGTSKYGILVYKNNIFESQISIKDGLKSNTIKKIEIQNDNIYILTTKGLQIYNLMTKELNDIGVLEGIVDGGITNFSLSNDMLWLLQKHSYYPLSLSSLNKKGQIHELFIDSVLINQDKYKFGDINELKSFQNSITFFFDYRHIETKRETTIEYILEGFNNDWKEVSSDKSSIEFSYLPTGNYNFKIRAKYRNLETETHQYSFSIVPPIYKRWWFGLLLGSLIIIFISSIAYYRILLLKKKNARILKNKEIEKNAIDAQLKAIRAQMNPHFIFNSINSIQDLVLRQETLKSYDYLVEFSKLVRSTLDFSEKEYIPFDKELTFLKTYLSLEKLRFKDDFEYSFDVSVFDDNKLIQIPSLIIQPFIENSIKHGLLHKAGVKKLNINFEIKNEVICTIIDNGIGIEEARKIAKRQKRGYVSFSTKAIQLRMKILNEKYGKNASYTTEDIIDEKGEVCGTKVVIKLPFL